MWLVVFLLLMKLKIYYNRHYLPDACCELLCLLKMALLVYLIDALVASGLSDN
jgi:hypothetical protein